MSILFMDNQGKRSKFLKKISLSSLSCRQPKEINELKKFDQQNNALPFKKKILHSLQKQELKNFKVLGMIKKQIFVITDLKRSLIGFVDQHAIHQRIRYQFFIKTITDSQNAKKFDVKHIEKSKKKNESIIGEKIQLLLFIKKGLIPKEKIEICGFTLVNHNSAIYLQSYRKIFGKKLEPQILLKISEQILENLEMQKIVIPNCLDNLIAQISCKAAIKFNDSITLDWCNSILFNIILCDFPWSCVHGRPTIHFKSQLPFKSLQYKSKYQL